MYKYKIVESHENDSLQTKIEKSGIKTEFVLQDVYNHKLKIEQEIKEKEGQVEIAKASMQNILNNHAEIKEIVDSILAKKNSQGILATLFLYIKHDIDKDNNQRMVDERKKLIEEYEKELDVIHTKLSIAKPVKIGFTKANE
jgi:hypothetical protein